MVLSDFESFYHRTKNYIYDEAYSVIKDQFLAEDATQEVYFRISKVYSKLHFQTSAAERTYLLRAARNAAIDQLRAKDPLNEAVELPDISLYEDEPFERLVANDMIDNLRRCFRRLSEQAQAVLSYRELGLSDKVIAATLGISVSSVRVTALRARRKLRAAVREEGITLEKI